MTEIYIFVFVFISLTLFSDQKMENYERQMAILKNKLSELQQDFGELSDMSKLRFVVSVLY